MPRMQLGLLAAWLLSVGCASFELSDLAGTGECSVVFVDHPSEQTVLEGESAVFVVTVTGSGATSHQWERSDDNGDTWLAVPGATAASCVISAATLADDGAWFRCVVTDDGDSVASSAATLTVEPCYGGWWEVYLDGESLMPLYCVEFEHVGTTVRYLGITMALEGDTISGVNGGGVGYDLSIVSHDILQGALVMGDYRFDVALFRETPDGVQSAQGALDLTSTTSYGCVETDGSDVYCASIDHMGCDRGVMVEIQAMSSALAQGVLAVGGDVEVDIRVEEMIDGEYAFSHYQAVGGTITFTSIDSTRVTGDYTITTSSGETITGSFDVPVFVIWS